VVVYVVNELSIVPCQLQPLLHLCRVALRFRPAAPELAESIVAPLCVPGDARQARVDGAQQAAERCTGLCGGRHRQVEVKCDHFRPFLMQAAGDTCED
jgi:hypothetical protein